MALAMITRIFDKVDLHSLAENNHFSSDGMERIVRLYELMEALSEDKVLANSIALKGGTALNLYIYGGVPRISEDLDFDLYGEDVVIKEDAIGKLENIILPRLKEIAVILGYQVELPARKRYGLESIFLAYDTKSGGRAKIKLEINYISRVHVLEPQFVKIYSPLLQRDLHAPLLNEHEIIAEKMCALCERTKPRDVFDIYTFSKDVIPKHKGVCEDIRRLFIFHAALHGLNLASLKNSPSIINELSFSDFRKGLLSMIRNGQGFFDINIYKAAALNTVKTIIDGLDEKEISFLNNYEDGIFSPELLFQTYAHLNNHPKVILDMANNSQLDHDEDNSFDPE